MFTTFGHSASLPSADPTPADRMGRPALRGLHGAMGPDEKVLAMCHGYVKGCLTDENAMAVLDELSQAALSAVLLALCSEVDNSEEGISESVADDQQAHRGARDFFGEHTVHRMDPPALEEALQVHKVLHSACKAELKRTIKALLPHCSEGFWNGTGASVGKHLLQAPIGVVEETMPLLPLEALLAGGDQHSPLNGFMEALADPDLAMAVVDKIPAGYDSMELLRRTGYDRPFDGNILHFYLSLDSSASTPALDRLLDMVPGYMASEENAAGLTPLLVRAEQMGGNCLDYERIAGLMTEEALLATTIDGFNLLHLVETWDLPTILDLAPHVALGCWEGGGTPLCHQLHSFASYLTCIDKRIDVDHPMVLLDMAKRMTPEQLAIPFEVRTYTPLPIAQTGTTALHLAAGIGFAPLVEYLIETLSTEDMAAVDCEGANALYHAVDVDSRYLMYPDRVEVVKLLLLALPLSARGQKTFNGSPIDKVAGTRMAPLFSHTTKSACIDNE